MIEDCINRQSKLSDWELKFIDDIQFKNSLSEKQSDKLYKIWEKVTE